MLQESILFYLFGSIAVIFTVLMLTRKNALSAAVCLIAVFLSFAGLYVMLDAPMVAAMQVLVYAGAIMMLIIFVIMTVDMKEDELKIEKPVILSSLLAGTIVLTCIAMVSFSEQSVSYGWALPAGHAFGTVENVGHVLFTRHLLNFEMISLLLLIALVGALVLVKKRTE